MSIQLTLYIREFYIIFNQTRIENIRGNIPESSKKQNLTLPFPLQFLQRVAHPQSLKANFCLIMLNKLRWGYRKTEERSLRATTVPKPTAAL